MCVVLAATFHVYGQQNATYIKRIFDFQKGDVSSIFDIYVGGTGLLYLGTDDGLMTFNGVSYQNIKFVDNLTISVHRIQEDQQGTIWCKNFSNQLFFLKNNVLTPFKKVEKLCAEKNDNFIDYTFFNGKLFVLTEQKLYKEAVNGVLEPVLDVKNLNFNTFHSIHKTSGKIFISGSSAIIEFDGNQPIATHKASPGQKELLLANNEVFYTIKGEDNSLNSLNKGRFFLKNIEDNPYFYGVNTTDSGLWLCTSNGLYKINEDTQAVSEKLLLNHRVTKIVQDKEGGSWISTLDNGLFYMPNPHMKQVKYENDNGVEAKFLSLARSADGHLFAGTSYGAVLEFDKNLKLVHIYKGSNNIEVEYISFYGNRLFTTIGVFDRNVEKPFKDAYFGKGVAADDFGNFVFATYNFAGLIPQSLQGTPTIPENLSVKNDSYIYPNNLKIIPFRNKRARVVHYSRFIKSYLIGFSDGLFKYHTSGSVEEIKTNDGLPIIAMDIKESANGNLWVATAQQGVFQISNNKVILNLNDLKDFSKNRCRKLHVAKDGVWIITNEGLNFYNTVTGEFINYVDRLGLSDTRINDFIVDSEKIWLATNKGIIHLKNFILNKPNKPVFQIKAKSIKDDVESIPAGAVLSYKANNIVFDFETIFFKSLGNFIYEYKLHPIHSEWQSQVSKQERLSFLSLKPGNYTLQARIKTGSTYSDVSTFNFTVAAPFWEMWWFRLMSFLILAALFLLVYNWAVMRTKKRQSINEKLAISQLTALRLQMNPHFMFNVLNAVQGLIYSNQKSKATEYLGTFSSLMRKTLDMSDKKEITIAQEMETIEIYMSLEKARFEDDEFEFDIILPDEDLTGYGIPSLIIQPFVENAIKHGLMHKSGKKILSINLSRADKYYWQFVIEDNGVGREAAAHINNKIKGKHNSFATKAIDNRIMLINKLIDKPISIAIEDLVSNQMMSLGTRVIIQIPVKEL